MFSAVVRDFACFREKVKKFEVRFLFSIFAKVRSQEFRKSVWSWSEIFIRDKKKSMEVVWNTEALVQCGGAPGTLRILRVFARFQLNISRFFFAILREPLVKPRVKVWGVALKITSP